MTRRQPFDPVDILALLDWTEYNELEFKSARGGVPKSLWETYSAMANTQRKGANLLLAFIRVQGGRGRLNYNSLFPCHFMEQQR